MKKIVVCFSIVMVVLGVCGLASGHFGMVIPSDSMVMQGDSRKVNVWLSTVKIRQALGEPVLRKGGWHVDRQLVGPPFPAELIENLGN